MSIETEVLGEDLLGGEEQEAAVRLLRIGVRDRNRRFGVRHAYDGDA